MTNKQVARAANQRVSGPRFRRPNSICHPVIAVFEPLHPPQLPDHCAAGVGESCKTRLHISPVSAVCVFGFFYGSLSLVCDNICICIRPFFLLPRLGCRVLYFGTLAQGGSLNRRNA